MELIILIYLVVYFVLFYKYIIWRPFRPSLKKRQYGTWQHPRSKLQHHYIFALQHDLKRFTNCESCAFGQLIDSDHRAFKCSIRFLVHLQRKRDPRIRLSRLDYTPLLYSKTKKSFANMVTSSLANQNPLEFHTRTLHIYYRPQQLQCSRNALVMHPCGLL
jgi:hypothetical protein